MRTALLGLDLGTGSVKALLIDAADGRILGEGAVSYPIERPEPGAAEQAPDRWWDVTCTATRMAVSQAGDATIAAIESHDLAALKTNTIAALDTMSMAALTTEQAVALTAAQAAASARNSRPMSVPLSAARAARTSRSGRAPPCRSRKRVISEWPGNSPAAMAATAMP